MIARLPILLVLPILALAAWPSTPVEASVLPMTVADLTQHSSLCVRGTVVDVQSQWTDDGGMIYTTYYVATHETLKGTAPQFVPVRVPGGDLDGVSIRNGEAPVYQLGEDVVAFLGVDPGEEGSFRTIGWFQGKMTLLGENVRELPQTSWTDLKAQIQAAKDR